VSEKAEKPENKKNYEYCPQHRVISLIDSNLATRSRVFGGQASQRVKNAFDTRLNCRLGANSER